MLQLTKTIHVLAIGLWFGMAVFFSFPMALSLFATFEHAAQQEPRPVWFPTGREFDQDPGSWNYSLSAGESRRIFQSPADVRREQGVRAAGAAIGPLFDWYFLLQGICGVLAVVTALPCTRAEPKVRAHSWRIFVLSVALLSVLLGWPLERLTSHLRASRDDATDAVLRSAPNIPGTVHEEAVATRHHFFETHGISLAMNFATVILVTVGMGLAARLPASSFARTSDARAPEPPQQSAG